MALDEFYKGYLQLLTNNAKNFKDSIKIHEQAVEDQTAKLEDHQNPSTLESVLLISSLVNMSNLYRRVAEKLVDQLGEEPHK